jgi:hypothetical protein
MIFPLHTRKHKLVLGANALRFSRPLYTAVVCTIDWLPANFPFGEEKLFAPLIAIPNVDKANRRQEKGKKLN